MFFFFNDTATTEIYTLSLHDALPIFAPRGGGTGTNGQSLTDGLVVDVSRHMNRILEINVAERWARVEAGVVKDQLNAALRSEEHTSELQSRQYLVCRLLLEKKKKNII